MDLVSLGILTFVGIWAALVSGETIHNIIKGKRLHPCVRRSDIIHALVSVSLSVVLFSIVFFYPTLITISSSVIVFGIMMTLYLTYLTEKQTKDWVRISRTHS